MNLHGMPNAETPENVVVNDDFYPELNVNELGDGFGVTSGYGTNVETILVQLRLAMVFVNKELATYQVTNWGSYSTLEDVPSELVDGSTHLELLYKEAVYSLTKAKLLLSRLSETNRDKQTAQQQQANDNEDHWRKQCYAAIRQMMNQSTTLTVNLL
jgi:hypothetical protein